MHGTEGKEWTELFDEPPAEAKSWVYWYWMEASVSREGITADLEAMAEAGIGGAYLMPIKGPADPPHMPPVNTLTPEWWAMLKHSVEEADRLGIEITLHASDGFSLAGGPWITPEQSMQRITWSKIQATGGELVEKTLPMPETKEDYYRDIAVYAYPSLPGEGESTRNKTPEISTSTGESADYLANDDADEEFRSEKPVWIEYSFEEPFMVRSVEIHPDGTNFQAKRLRLEVSDDGEHYFPVRQMESPRHGWQDWDIPLTYSIPPTRARHFRFYYDPEGSEPGAEDLDSAKWSPVLKLRTLHLLSEPKIHQYEGKSGRVWRMSRRTEMDEVPDYASVDPDDLVDLSGKVDEQGNLEWEAPPGEWTILRMGHTSTGHTNATGGAGEGLEADKFNPEVAELQFDRWFGEALRQVGPDLAERVITGFHTDSWECGSQNWSPVFRDEFKKLQGYDPLDWLPAMAGVPIKSAEASERFLHDIRDTISQLIDTKFFGTMKELSAEAGCRFSAEAVAPIMMSDGMLHHRTVDIPMGEFWLRSPTHDKPNDMLDAISGARIYGKRIVQAEAFTELRMAWDEHPGMLKALGDRNLALGINRFVFHVFTHNPWLDREPGMTLDGVGLYFQRDQTWWEPGKAWLEYLERVQAMLQQGRPVVDIAVFTGESYPRRAVLPNRLVPVLPGLFGEDRVKSEQARLRNEGLPLRELPKGVNHSANMAIAENWVDPLRGYAYDSINPDALLRLATVRDGRIELPGGASYGVLVIPGPRRLSPHADYMSREMLVKIRELVQEGATVLFESRPRTTLGRQAKSEHLPNIDTILDDLWPKEGERSRTLDDGVVLTGPYTENSLDKLGIERDILAREDGKPFARNLAWTHHESNEKSFYFISNQESQEREIEISFRVSGYQPEIWDPVTGTYSDATTWSLENGRTIVPLKFEASQSCFVVFRKKTASEGSETAPNFTQVETVGEIEGPWKVKFDPDAGGPESAITFPSLMNWRNTEKSSVKYYSGTAEYNTEFQVDVNLESTNRKFWLDLGRVENLGRVIVNGEDCGVVWTAPHRLDVTHAIRQGENALRIEVTNTWANRLIRDNQLDEEQRVTWTRAPYRLGDGPLLSAGLLGPVKILRTEKAADEE